MPFKFSLLKTIHKARLGKIETSHGTIETPAFIPVATRGTVKTLTNQQLIDIGTQIIIGNTYHLMLRPGIEIIAKAGGLHPFMDWPFPIITDSGGFQVFSLASLNQVMEEGVYFQSHIDGSKHFLGPLESMQIQKDLRSDIVTTFDECSPYPGDRKRVEVSLERTHHWAIKCRDFALHPHQCLFAIVQGGGHLDLRQQAVRALKPLNFEGYAIGSLLGASQEMINATMEAIEPILPQEKPRYLMGIGTPRNIIEAAMRGVDLFDCVLPTRNARNGTAYTWSGKMIIGGGKYADDLSPFDPQLNCYASQFSKAYIRHLLNVDEITGLTLVSLQNVAFYLDFMRQLRQAILQENIQPFYERVCALYPEP